MQELWLLKNVLPPHLFVRWMLGIVGCWKTLLQKRSLGPLDQLMGAPFSILWHNKEVFLNHTNVGLVREIFAHQCYARHGELVDATHILDLGANAGVFTLFALLEAPNAHVHAVEAQAGFVESFKHNLNTNGLQERATIEQAVVGGGHDDWTNSLLAKEPDLQVFNIQDYINQVGICDFIKCDVEGGEFPLLSGDIDWLDNVRSMVMEVHHDKGNAKQLETTLQEQGFIVKTKPHGIYSYFYCTKMQKIPIKTTEK
jgi:FkbM family methyltransferase